MQVERVNERISGITKVLEGLADLFPGLAELEGQMDAAASVVAGRQMGTAEAVMAVLTDPRHTDKRWTVTEMTRELVGYGFKPNAIDPANSVRAALGRLAKDKAYVFGVVDPNTNHMTYVYHPPSEADWRRDLEELSG